jgi:YggT family protein
MFVLGNFLKATAYILNIILNIYIWIIIIRALVSWVSPSPYNPIVRFLYAVTEPVLYPIRRYLPVYFGGFDFSPIVVLLVILFLQQFLVATLYQLALSLA